MTKKMMNMKNKTIALFVLLMSTLAVTAQNPTGFQIFIEDVLENKISNINSHADVAPFMRSFSEDCNWVNVNVDIDGKISTPLLMNKQDLSNRINYLASRPALSLKWEIEQYHELTKREDRRIASLKVKVSILANGDLIQSGYNIVKVIAQKKGEMYSINYMDILQVSSESYQGPCYVKLQTEDNINYTADIAYPNGNEYSNFYTHLKVIPADPFKAIVIENVDQRYYWNPKTNDVSLDKKGRKIGNASNTENSIIMTLSDQAKDKCSKLIRTAKK